MVDILMMKTLSVLAIASITISLTLIGATDTFAKPESKNFVAPLAGNQEFPPVDTKATGLAKFQINKDGDAINYKLIVANIENVVAAHIHVGAKGTNGGVLVPLFSGLEAKPNGILAEGTITSDDTDIGALIEAMRSGDTYVNVHTLENRPGEIRGQIAEAGPSK